MKKYKAFLKGLLVVNLLFILLMAGIGYWEQRTEKKTTSVSGEVAEKVIPVGKTIGIYVNTQGILVIDTGEVIDRNGNCVTPAKNKLMPGDYILSLNGTAMKTKKELIEAITCCDGAELVFEVERKGEQTAVKVSPVETQQGVYKVGIWVRDDLQGLGTITYVKGDSFGALGHSINDSDTGTLLQVSGGDIYAADIFGVEKGSAGSPGEIEGVISYQTENVVGQIEENRTYGIYGSVTESFLQELSLEAVEVADSREVECGTAWIQSDVTGTLSQYEIEIVNVHKNEQGDPELEFLVTDAELIAETGGIIQGMSGSPILQNGKLVGAVTHVFVEEPTRGYGIFAASMLENTD